MNNRFSWFFLITFLIFPLFCFPQGENNNWYFGKHAGVTFNFGFPVALTNCAASFADKLSPYTVSDSAGNLLFYTGEYYESENSNGTVWNKNSQFMPNGRYLYTGWETSQNYIAVQKIDDDSSYYLFAMDEEYGAIWNPFAKGLTYSVIDMRLDGGLGDIVASQKSIQVPGAEHTEDMLSCTRHANNRDVWVTVRDYWNSSNYLTYLVTAAGINTVPVVSTSLFTLIFPSTFNTMVPGMIRFSPDGTKLVCLYSDSLEYCQFNLFTGQITPMFKSSYDPAGSGTNYPNAEFSVNNKYLYIFADGKISQYDASTTDSMQFHQSKVLIYNFLNDRAWLQRGPDNKIYFSVDMKDSIGVINNPAIQGTGCNFQRDAVCLEGTNHCYEGLPQFLQRYYVYIHHTFDCVNQQILFHSITWPPADSIHWDFGDPSSGANTSDQADPTHLFTSTGSFTVTLFVRHNDQRTDTTSQVITILPAPNPQLGPDRTICLGNTTAFDAGFCTGCTYMWSNLTLGLMNIGTGQTLTTGESALYQVQVTMPDGCFGYGTIQLFTTPVPQLTNNPLLKTICSGDSTHIPLTSNVPGATFHWTATLTSGNITGYSADSGLMVNQVLINTLPTAGIVTYHITPKVGSCAGTTVDFPVTVNQGDSVKVSISASANNICAGTSVTFTATPTNGGTTPSYGWKVNGNSVGTNSPNYTYAPSNGDLVSCILTSSNIICTSNNPATSNSVIMVIMDINDVSVLILPSANPVCSGTSVTFTATPANGGLTPSYQWKVNGISVGSNLPTYAYNPASGDLVSCIITSNIQCPSGNPATSNAITMIVNPNLPVSVSISASADPICQGSSATYTATPVNGGTAPIYQWKVNGIIVGTNSSSYSYIPLNGDLVSCTMTSDIQCPIANPVTSNILSISISNNLPVGISIAASTNPFCPGNSVVFTATPVNGGPNPAYQWKVNGINRGTNSPAYTYNPASGDLVSCIMTSNLSCVTANPATSNTITMSGTLASVVTFTRCFDSITTTTAQPFKLTGGIPLGGTYSGLGVSNGIFHPIIAGIGIHQITYTYTNASLCAASATVTIVTIITPVTTCGQPITDPRDNKTYQTVQIGNQCWMAEDLNYGTQISSAINQRDNCTPEKYHNPASSIEHPASVYQWDEIMNYGISLADQGLCPPGWHVPSEADWNILFAEYTNNGFAASPLKYSGFSGFNALLNGARHLNEKWDYAGFATFFWSSTAHSPLKAWAHGMNDLDPSVSAYPAFRTNAFSVRCLKD